jgi:hypothetical protein
MLRQGKLVAAVMSEPLPQSVSQYDCGRFYVMTSLRDVALAADCLSRSQVKVITTPDLKTIVYCTLVLKQKCEYGEQVNDI